MDDRARLLQENERLREELARLRAQAGGDALALDLARAIQGLPLLLFLFDADDRFVAYRAGRAADLYAAPESFEGKRIDDVLPAGLGARFREVMAEARATGKDRLEEYGLDMPSGRQEFEARVVPLAAGRVAMLVTDVTERRRRDERLRESEERFRLAFENAPIGMALVGLDERILDANGALCAILGRPRERLVGMTVPEITHPDDRAREEAAKDELRRGDDDSYRLQKRYLRSDGAVVWGQLSVSAVNGPDGRPRYFIGQLEDVTERRLALERLRANEERYRALSENATDALAVLDTDRRVSVWSRGASELLGWAAGEMVGRMARELVHPDDLPATDAVVEEMARTPGVAQRATFRFRHRDGSWHVLDAVARNLLHLPSVAGIVVNARDVTEERRLEQEVQHAQRLESIGRLAGGVAHDFNNVLTVILSCAEELEADLAAGRARAEDVREILAAAARARDLTRQLLAFARRQVIAPVALDLNALLQDSHQLLSRVVGEDVAVSLRLAPDLWTVRADPAQLQQVLLNLVVNARDAMPRGGRLQIETANAEPDPGGAAGHPDAAPGPHVRLSVRDSGEGMTDEARAHVFEPFFTTKPAGRGTGLGLATVYGIVRQSGGHVWVETERGRGTAFHIHLPRAAEGAAPAAEVAAPARATGGSETVLVVEDEPRVREVTARALRAAGYRVLEADGGRAALALAATAPAPALLVTDVVMPEMSGREVAEALQRRWPRLRVLYVSGYTQDAIVHHGVLDSGIEFLAKPLTPSVLVARVREILDAP